MSARLPWRAYGLLTLGMAVVGTYVGFSRLLVAVVPIYLLGLIRFSIGGLFMLPWTFPPGGLAVLRRHGGTLFLQSLFGNFLFTICMLGGIAHTSATAAGLIMSSLPAVVALFSLAILGEAIGYRTVIAIALAIAGIAVLNLAGNAGGERTESWFGNVLIVAAVCCEALYVVLGKRLTTARVGAMQISAWINIAGLFLMLPLGLWQAASFGFDQITSHTWILIVAYALGASVLSTWLWLSGLKSVPASQAGVFTLALPISAALVGLVFLNESLGWAHIVAFCCALACVLLVTQDGQSR